jgi:uncharacterized protein (DUF983 family)
MSASNNEAKPGFLKLFSSKCPRCREGDMFLTKNPYRLQGFMKMHDTCPVCGDYFDKEVGFYYGSSYVSYAFSIAISVATFVAWWVLLGFSLEDNRVFYWLAFNAILLVVLQPLLMRLARTFWLAFFVRYDKDWKLHPPVKPEGQNEALRNAW